MSAVAWRKAGQAAISWEDAALESTAGKLVGERCIEAVWRMVWRI